jgi:hypothetical protein
MKTTFFYFLYLFLLPCAFAQTIPNGDFESWGPPFNGNDIPDNFAVLFKIGAPPSVMMSTDRHSGNASILITSGGSTLNAATGVESDTIFSPLKPKYLTGFFKANGYGAGDTMKIIVSYADTSTPTVTYVISCKSAINTGWTGFYLPLNIPASFQPKGVTVNLISSYGSETDSTWFDDLAFSDAAGSGILFGSTSVQPVAKPDQPVQVFPNPTAGNINVSCAAALEAIQIYTATGELVYAANPQPAKNISLDVNVPDGLYLLKAITPAGSVLSRIIITR